ncbi:hypothetical protein [Amycolatopsis sp. NBC_00438]
MVPAAQGVRRRKVAAPSSRAGTAQPAMIAMVRTSVPSIAAERVT